MEFPAWCTAIQSDYEIFEQKLVPCLGLPTPHDFPPLLYALNIIFGRPRILPWLMYWSTQHVVALRRYLAWDCGGGRKWPFCKLVTRAGIYTTAWKELGNIKRWHFLRIMTRALFDAAVIFLISLPAPLEHGRGDRESARASGESSRRIVSWSGQDSDEYSAADWRLMLHRP